jgi:hypothetical protein
LDLAFGGNTRVWFQKLSLRRSGTIALPYMSCTYFFIETLGSSMACLADLYVLDIIT